MARPAKLPWDEVLAELAAAHANGVGYQALADDLSRRYGITVAAGSVSRRLREYRLGYRAPQYRDTGATDDRVYAYLLEHPRTTVAAIARDLTLPLTQARESYHRVRATRPGYLIAPERTGQTHYTDDDIFAALREAHERTGAGKWLSHNTYRDFRASLPPSERKRFPSPVALMRRFGTWSVALENAGLQAGPRPRVEYTGVGRDGTILHLAHYLRGLREKSTETRSMGEASVADYRLWVHEHPHAPSVEQLLIYGRFTDLAEQAAAVERALTALPPAPSVQGRKRPKDLLAPVERPT